MSRFIDKLKQASQAAPQSMGFKVMPAASSKPRMLLVASLSEAHDENLAEFVSGADAWLLVISKLSSGLKDIKKVSQTVSGIPWGGWLRNTGRRIAPTAKLDCDFLVFPAVTTSLAAIQNEEVGKILEVEPSLGEGMLKAVNELPVDAVLIVGENKEGLTWHHLMLFQRFADLLTKPLLASIPSKVTAGELQAIWEAGVNGVVVEVGVGHPVNRVSELRQAIDKLAFPWQSKRRKATGVLLPYVASEKRTVVEEEEEE
jgi:hypothetical protein